jgi:hypothetical protein
MSIVRRNIDSNSPTSGEKERSMRRLRGARVRWLALGVAIVAIVGTGTALAAYPQTVPVYTGCLNTSGNGAGTIGSLTQNATTPLKPCGQNQLLIHLSGGTITEITAGTGLTGGGSNGSVTINLASSYQLPQGCAVGKIVKWNGSAWACADDQTYANGTGLDLNSNTFSIDSNYRLPQSCNAGQVAKSGGPSTDWSCGDQNSYSGNDFALSNQSCSSGQFVNGIDSTGHTQCGNDQTYSGANFALSNQSCAAGDFVSSIDSSGNVVCAAGSATGLNSVYTNSAFIDVGSAPSTPAAAATCTTGDVATGGGVELRSLEGTIKEDHPFGLPSNQWQGEADITSLDPGNDHELFVYVICAKTG